LRGIYQRLNRLPWQSVQGGSCNVLEMLWDQPRNGWVQYVEAEVDAAACHAPEAYHRRALRTV